MKKLTLLLCLSCFIASSQISIKKKVSNKTILKSRELTYTIVVNKKTNKRDSLIAYNDLLLINRKQKH
jgi:hypothetical protein